MQGAHGASDDRLDLELWERRLAELGQAVCAALRARNVDLERDSRVLRDDDGDSIFAIDVDAEELVLQHAEVWAQSGAFELICEGLEPAGNRSFGEGPSLARVILDPIDGTRGLMFDKRSAWFLGAVAPDRGPTTSLQDIEVAVMVELPTSRQASSDLLVAQRGGGARGVRRDLRTGEELSFIPRPSRATELRHGFATVCNFFQGGKELTSRLDEELMRRALGGWTVGKAEVYTDQYISSGGQLAEVALGRDRFVLDARPLIHRALGHDDTLCSRPYDLCTAMVATEAGCVVTDPWLRPLDAPLDTTTNVGFAAFANRELYAALGPLVLEALQTCGLGHGAPGGR
ncbi:MAG: inositol monophosphatase [Planctomycetota bacterium]